LTEPRQEDIRIDPLAEDTTGQQDRLIGFFCTASSGGTKPPGFDELHFEF